MKTQPLPPLNLAYVQSKADDLIDSLADSQVRTLAKSLYMEKEIAKEKALLARKALFGSLSEKSQPSLFDFLNEPETIVEDASPEELEEAELKAACEQEPVQKKRKKNARKARKEQLESRLEVKEVHLHQEAPACPVCGTVMKEVGTKSSDELMFQPATFYIRRTVDHIWACPEKCEDGQGKVQITSSQAAAGKLFPGSLASPSAVAEIINQKYMLFVPLYRYEHDLKRKGIPLSRAVMGLWLTDSVELFLSPVYGRMCQDFQSLGLIHMDETTVKVIDEMGKEDRRSTCYMIVGASGEREEKQMVIYQFSRTRQSGFVGRMAGTGYSGVLMTDGYAGYDRFAEGSEGEVVRLSCMAHARRKFVEALECREEYRSYKKLRNNGAAQNEFLASYPGLRLLLETVNLFDQLYKVEKRCTRDMDSSEVRKVRQERSQPILDQISTNARKIQEAYAPRSHGWTAAEYYLKRQEQLERYVENGEYPIDNNLCERMVKPFVQGRKNFLFCITTRGAEVSSALYSLCQTCVMNGVDPYRYFEYALTELSRSPMSPELIERLLPYSHQLPDSLYVK